MDDFSTNNSLGWIKLFRSVAAKGWYKDSNYVHLWIHLLISANHKGKQWFYKGKNYTVNPGQFITSRKSLSHETGISESKVERILKTFKIEQQIEQQNLFTNRLISITNWDAYQKIEQQIEQQANSKRTASEQQANTNNNVTSIKNDKNDKKVLLSQVDESTLNDEAKMYYEVAISFWKLFKSNLTEIGVSVKEIEIAEYTKWVGPIRLLFEKDGRTIEEVREIFTFLKNDEFWKEQIRSTAKFRKKDPEGIKYFDKLLIKSRNEQRKQFTSKEEKSGVSQDYKNSILERLLDNGSSEEMQENK